jgi:hypothetical protein
LLIETKPSSTQEIDTRRIQIEPLIVLPGSPADKYQHVKLPWVPNPFPLSNVGITGRLMAEACFDCTDDFDDFNDADCSDGSVCPDASDG